MSREAYQRGVAEMLRAPETARATANGAAATQGLSADEHANLVAMAGQQGMEIWCMLYRASRLVGIARRLPRSVALLGPCLRALFDAYVAGQPDACADFDSEAQHFAAFLRARLARGDLPDGLPGPALAATLAAEAPMPQ